MNTPIIPEWLRQHGSHLCNTSLETDWFSTRRKESWKAFEEQGLPISKHECWKHSDFSCFYTPFLLEDMTKLQLTPTEATEILGDIELKRSLKQDTKEKNIRLIFINGRFIPELSDQAHLSALGIVACPLKGSENNCAAVFVAAQCCCLEDHVKHYAMAYLNRILADDGLLLIIPENCDCNTSIHFISITHHCKIAAYTMPLQYQIHVGKQSSATIVEEHYTSNSMQNNTLNDKVYPAYINMAMSSIQVESGATLDYYKLQQEHAGAAHFANTFVQQAANSTVNYFTVSTGGFRTRDDLCVILKGNEATFYGQGLYTVKQDQQTAEHHLRIEHRASETHSHVLYKGIADHESRAIFTSDVLIPRNIHGAVASQANHNLLLSSQAAIYTAPRLEIYSDDVQCKHGATVGQLDKNALFYLRTRGLSEKHAIAILLDGFLNDLLNNIRSNDMKQRVEAIL